MTETSFTIALFVALGMGFFGYLQGKADAEAVAERWARTLSPACQADMDRVAEELKAQDEPTRRRGE